VRHESKQHDAPSRDTGKEAAPAQDVGIEAPLGTDFSEATFDRQASALAVAGAPRPGAAMQRASVAQDIQRTYGNAHVQRLANRIAQAKAEPGAVQRDFTKINDDPGVDLDTEEAGGGHTIDRHVGKGNEYLTGRITAQGIDVASSYPDKATAETAVNDNLKANKSETNTWLFDPSVAANATKAVRHTSGGNIGGYLDEHNVMDKKGRERKAKRLKDTKKNVVVVRKKAGGGGFVLTSFPEP